MRLPSSRGRGAGQPVRGGRRCTAGLGGGSNWGAGGERACAGRAPLRSSGLPAWRRAALAGCRAAGACVFWALTWAPPPPAPGGSSPASSVPISKGRLALGTWQVSSSRGRRWCRQPGRPALRGRAAACGACRRARLCASARRRVRQAARLAQRLDSGRAASLSPRNKGHLFERTPQPRRLPEHRCHATGHQAGGRARLRALPVSHLGLSAAAAWPVAFSLW